MKITFVKRNQAVSLKNDRVHKALGKFYSRMGMRDSIVVMLDGLFAVIVVDELK